MKRDLPLVTERRGMTARKGLMNMMVGIGT